MKRLRISNRLELKAARFQDRRIAILKNYRSSHLKTSNNQREESQRVEWHQRIKFQRIKVIWTTVFSLQALVEINPQLLKTVLSLSSNNLVVQFRKLQLPDCHRSTLSPTVVRCKAKTSHTTQVRNNKLDISSSWMEEDSLQVTTSNFWKRIKINRSQLMSQVTRAAYKSKRIWICVEAPKRPELIAKIIRVHITPARINQTVWRKWRVVHILRIIDLGQLQSSSSKVIVTLDLSTLEWWALIKCQLPTSIHQELEVALTFKLIKTRDQALAKSTPIQKEPFLRRECKILQLKCSDTLSTTKTIKQT